jgi:predicted enzyme related to lactoylglutathione lyase
VSINPSALCQVEIPSSDLTRSLQFYLEVLGWTEAPCDIHNYKVLNVPEGNPFGVSLVGGASFVGKPQGIVLYFRSDDPDLVVRRAERFYDRPISNSRSLPGYGTIKVIEDPDGHRIGLYRPD